MSRRDVHPAELKNFVIAKRLDGFSNGSIVELIRREFGHFVTIGVVAGIVHRSGVRPREPDNRPQVTLDVPRKLPKPKPLVPLRRATPEASASEFEGFRVYTESCQWDDCSKRAVRGSYCAEHGELVYIKPKKTGPQKPRPRYRG